MPKRKLFKIIKTPILFVLIMWIVKIIEYYFNFSFSSYGIFPRDISGVKGIVFFSFIHQDLKHLLSNTYPILILGSLLFYYYKKVGLQIFFCLFFISGIWLWAIGRSNYHIGASGMVYALASFIFFSGIMKKQTKLAAASLLVIFLYGSMIWGILPIYEGVSWEGHLSGLLAGFLVAIFFKSEGPKPKKYQWEIEEDLEGDNTQINYVLKKEDYFVFFVTPQLYPNQILSCR